MEDNEKLNWRIQLSNSEIKIPSSVYEILLWKDKSYKIKEPKSVEEKNIKYMNKCGAASDVLYSFLGIYAIGVWVYNKEKLKEELFTVDANRIRTINDDDKNQYLWSIKFLLVLQEREINGIKVEALNIFLNKEDGFASHYFDVGNVIPIWPGGNTQKGNQNLGNMDIPEIYFHKYLSWFDILSSLSFSYLNCMSKKVKEERFGSLKKFLDSVDTIESYNEYIDYIVSIIKARTKLIEDDNLN